LSVDTNARISIFHWKDKPVWVDANTLIHRDELRLVGEVQLPAISEPTPDQETSRIRHTIKSELRREHLNGNHLVRIRRTFRATWLRRGRHLCRRDVRFRGNRPPRLSARRQHRTFKDEREDYEAAIQHAWSPLDSIFPASPSNSGRY